MVIADIFEEKFLKERREYFLKAMDLNQAALAIVFLLIMCSVLFWLLSLCQDGTHHNNTSQGTDIEIF